MARRPRPRSEVNHGPRRALVALVLASLAFAAQARIVRHEFVSIDDNKYIAENPRVLEGLTGPNVGWALTTGYFSNWHPLTWLSHMLDVELFGPRAGGHHLMNLLLHAANTALLFFALDRLVRIGNARAGQPNDPHSIWQSAFVAALFAVHPLHVESVAWASERKDTLSTLFWLLTLLAYGAYVERPSVGRYIGVAVSLALGLMAKPMLVTLPAVLLLLDYWPLRRWQPGWATTDDAPSVPFTRLVVEKLPLVALVVASSLVTVVAQQSGGAVGDLVRYPLAGRVWNAVLSYVSYLGKTFWPAGLEFFYPYPRELLAGGWREPRLIAALLLLVALTGAALWLGRSKRYVLVGWLWFLGTLIPVIGLVQVGNQALADRYTYVPLIGLFVIVAWGLPDLLRWRAASLRPLAGAALVVVAVLAVLTWRQAGVWRDTRTLYEHALSVDPHNALAHYNLGLHEVAERDYEAARREFAAATESDPGEKRAFYNLGIEWQRAGRNRVALDAFEHALQIDPNYALALHSRGRMLLSEGRAVEAECDLRRASEALTDLAIVPIDHARALLRLGRIDEARERLQRALEIEPQSDRARGWLGIALARSGQPREARSDLEQALKMAPENPEPHLGLGDLAAQAEQWREAVAHYREAAREVGVQAEAERKIGEIALRVGEKSDALSWFEQSIAHNPHDPLAHWGYSQALAASNQPDRAQEQRELATKLANEQAAQGSKVALPR